MFKNYLKELNTLIFRPILFYTKLPAGDWKEEGLTFCGITAFVISFFASIVIFITQYWPIGVTLLEKVNPSKVIIVAPVMLVLAFMFFVITITLSLGLFLGVLSGLFIVLSFVSMVSAKIFGAVENFKNPGSVLKSFFYLSGTTLIFILVMFFVVLTKKGLMDFTNFTIGYNMIYGLWVLYVYGMISITIRKVYGLPKWKSFLGAIIPALFLLVLGFFGAKVVLPKISPWII